MSRRDYDMPVPAMGSHVLADMDEAYMEYMYDTVGEVFSESASAAEVRREAFAFALKCAGLIEPAQQREYDHSCHDEETRPNRPKPSLIEASPDLYAALKAMCEAYTDVLDGMNMTEDFTGRLGNAHRDAISALNKARGEPV